MIDLPLLKNIPEGELKGKRVVARFDFNVPISGGKVADDFRLRKSMSTLEFLRDGGAKTVLLSHLEDVYSKVGGVSSLWPVYELLKDKFDISFAKNVDEAIDLAKGLEVGQMILVDNLRFDEGEKNADESFAAKLALLGDIYLNEAFSVSHRDHASITKLPKLLPSYIGPLFASEVENLSKALQPEHPALFILGGAKFESKLPIIEKYLNIADTILVAGALANDFFKAKGFETGSSSVYGKYNIDHLLDHPKVILPVDVAVWTNEGVQIRRSDDVKPGDKIQDIGPESLLAIKPIIDSAKFILWNGPLGNYEMGFREKTVELAKMIASAPGFSVVGGGDTTAVIAKAGLEDKFNFMSTGGGAMLEFLEKGSLPGIEALKPTEQ